MGDAEIEAFWGLPAWNGSDRFGKIPLIGRNWTVQAGLQTRRALAAMRRKMQPDALFFHTQVTATLLPDWLKRFPSILSLDATPKQYDRLGAFYHHTPGPPWLEDAKWRLNRICFRLARHLVTWSEWARQGLVDEYGVPPEKISVIPPGVDTRLWSGPVREDPQSSPVRILFVGGDLERKGGRLLLEAFRILRENLAAHPSCRPGRRAMDRVGIDLELHLVTRTRLDAEPGVFVYPDLNPNSLRLKELYFHSDIFCLPTQGDCLPMVLQEAGAAGLPVVSTRLAAIPEIVLDGKTGFLVPPHDLEALIGALQRLILNPGLRMSQGQAARQMVGQRYDARCNTHRLLELMKQTSAVSGVERAGR